MPAPVRARRDAVSAWDYWMPLLLQQRVITRPFRIALENFCLAYADQCMHERVIAAAGFAPYVVEYTTGPDGTERERLRPHPVMALREHADRRVTRWAVQLGLTPASVAKVSTSTPSIREGSGPLALILGRTGRQAR